MELAVRLGAPLGTHLVEMRVDGDPDGADLVGALVESRHLEPADRHHLRLQRTGRLLDVGLPLSELGLRNGDLLIFGHDTDSSGRTRAGFEVVVASGPGAGMRVPLGSTGLSVGRDAQADLCVDDPGLSRSHFRVCCDGDRVMVEDLGSSNGTFVLGRRVTAAPVPVPLGIPVEAGSSAFRVEDVQDVDPPRLAVRDGRGEFNRPPRVARPRFDRQMDLPAPPDPRPKRRIPVASAFAPLVIAPLLVFFGGGLAFLAMMALSPVIMLASWWEDRHHGGKDHAESVRRFEAALDRECAAQTAQIPLEAAERWRASPDPAELLRRAQVPGLDLWERRRGDKDFLRLRLGWSDLSSDAQYRLADGGDPATREQATKRLEPLLMVPASPVTVDLADVGSLAVIGSTADARGVLRSLILQLAVLHSPRDLRIAAVTTTSLEGSWVARLPHTAAEEGSCLVAVGATEARKLFATLGRLVEERLGHDRDSLSGSPTRQPAVVVVVDGGVELPRSLLTGVLENGPRVGVHALWVSDSKAQVPGYCNALAAVSAGTVTVTWATTGTVIDGASVDSVPAATVDAVGWALAGLRDSSTLDTASEVPAKVALSDALGLQNLRPEVIEERWKGASGLGAPIGRTAQGIHWVDLRSDGPHALLGGTTGAGKSELLQTLVVSLATHHPPERLTFLLVDYKGGAAFKDCVALPHTVGCVTDLDGHLVHRVLVSLNAELSHRERLLAAVGARDILEMERISPDSAPPSLLLVVDEFAALASELPEFVDGVVSLAQRGRSLGMHLVLATQRPAGAINDNIRANTNLRISLRMNDVSDSDDVIGSPLAAKLSRSLPGRAYLRTGATELEEVQIAFGGGRSFGKATAPASVVVANRDGFGRTTRTTSTAGANTELTDLQMLAAAIGDAAQSGGHASPRVPWLPPLPALVSTSVLPAHDGTEVALGLRDEPQSQNQEPHSVDLASSGGLLVAGSGGSGKTTVLRTLAGRLAEQNSPQELHLYALDFGGRGLAALARLPHCGDVISGEETERVTRLLSTMRRAVTDRRRLLADAGVTSYDELRARQRRAKSALTPRIVVLLDGYGSFAQAFERVEFGAWLERLPILISDGRSLGLHWAITAERRMSVPTSLMAALSDRLILRFHDVDEYDGFGLDRSRISGAELQPGRGFASSSDEVQVAVYGSSGAGGDQAAALETLGDHLETRHPDAHVPKVRLLPESLDASELPAHAGPGRPVIGVSDQELAPVEIDLHESSFLVVGPRRSGKSSALATAVRSLHAADSEACFLLLAPRPSPLRGLMVWKEAYGPGPQAEEAMDRLLDEVGDRSANDPWLYLVVDDAHEYADETLEMTLADIARRGREVRVRLLVAADRSSAQRAYSGVVQRLRSDRAGLLLQPDVDIDGDLLGAQLDRRHGGGPPGRGVLVANGEGERIHVARWQAES